VSPWHNGPGIDEGAGVARTRFDWSALPAAVLQQLMADFRLTGDDPAAAVAAHVGEEPTELFVKGAWATLRDGWIAKSPPVRRSVVSALLAEGLGATSITGRSARAEVEYLRSCRNAPTLRAIVLAQLLAVGHAGDGAGGTDGTARAGETARVHAPASPDELRAKVKEVVRAVLGTDDVLVDKDGDIPIPSQASLTYVRVFKDVPVVRVFSPILWEFGDPADIEETLNDINRHTNWVKAVWENGAVVLFSDVVGAPLAESQLAAAIQSVVRRADEMGPMLQQRYGGRTAFGAPVPPRQPPPIGGYL
jgi:Putative bacterial sensory transduction regulator